MSREQMPDAEPVPVVDQDLVAPLDMKERMGEAQKMRLEVDIDGAIKKLEALQDDIASELGRLTPKEGQEKSDIQMDQEELIKYRKQLYEYQAAIPFMITEYMGEKKAKSE